MSSHQRKNTKGFTLIEIMIVVGIVAIISAVVLSNMPLYRGNIAIDREAGTFSLSLRKVQQYSIAVRRFDADFSSAIPVGCNNDLYKAQFPAYGITLDRADTSAYALYADPDCDKKSNTYPSPGSNGDLIEMIPFNNRVALEDICINVDSSTPLTCASGGAFDRADIWYTRPGPLVNFTLYDSGGNVVALSPESLKICLNLPDGGRRGITVRKSGQVSIQNEGSSLCGQ